MHNFINSFFFGCIIIVFDLTALTGHYLFFCFTILHSTITGQGKSIYMSFLTASTDESPLVVAGKLDYLCILP